jgi:hypothetical protein
MIVRFVLPEIAHPAKSQVRLLRGKTLDRVHDPREANSLTIG